MQIDENQNPFSLVADFEGDESSVFEVDVDETLPILPLRNMVLFPGVVMPVAVGRKSSLKLVKAAEKKNFHIGVVCQLTPETDNPLFEDLYHVGTVAKIVKVLELPDQSITVILQGMSRFELSSIIEESPYLIGNAVKINDELPAKDDAQYEILVESCREVTMKYIKMNEQLPRESIFAIKNISNKTFLINFICANFPFAISRKMELLSEGSMVKRTEILLRQLNKEIQYAELRAEIQRRTREDLDVQQKEYFLQQQIKNIQDELGGTPQDQDIRQLRNQAAMKNWNEEIEQVFQRELAKLERLNPQSPDYNVQLNYLQTLLSLPWNTYTEDNLNLKNAEKVLNKDHYGLEKVKERILEHLAVLRLRGDLKAPIICLYGPPGVGKTSLGRSVATALKRKYVRMSLGGLHDESEIRGHRKTYIGAMPGRIIKNLIKAESSNPVFILDEIDKISQNTVQGDPSSALLEVLDPEQNNAFHDNFLDLDYDLSKVLFIATANNIGTIPRPLLDRMELIEVSGYITEEKIEIAKRHLIPKEKENNGLAGKSDIKFSRSAIEFMIENYTRESGVRGLEKKINKVFRKIALEYARTNEMPYSEIKPADIETLLGKPEFTRDIYQGNEYAGVVTGLAWTSVGGEILFIETSLSKGKPGKLTLTGNLGDVMKESAMLALEYIKAHAEDLNIDNRIFENWNIHIHVPEGAVPKDGPSAGITMATSLASALTQRKVRSNLAMTGEITLRGKVLPVGGIKEKILAARRAGIKDIILCKENKKNIEEIPAMYLKGLTFHYVDNVEEVLQFALLKEKVKHPIIFKFEENNGDHK
ncbi:endopeptidase La [Bacteroides sp. OF04-15BH]|uniref:endopeptidase La n=1 Tax=Bacteroides sp. OF04-15BH TaxID=2292281 RepID=UPI000E4BC9F2|nr:endopeptidase La [Bacteroides sp. OF04-15BH]RHP62683.1 endopeptidase La [Bacteroides sp. OF04-15BH]